jgi:hypothetical protein
MIMPLTPVQKLIAYCTLALVAFWTVFGLFTIWLYLQEFYF